MNKEALLKRLIDIEWDDFEAKKAQKYIRLFALSLASLFPIYAQAQEIGIIYGGPSVEVFSENGKDGLKDQDGKVVIPAIYDGINSLRYFYRLELNRKYGLATLDSGKIVLPAEYDEINRFVDREVSVLGKDGKYGLLDTQGRFVAPLAYDGIWNQRDGVMEIRQQGRYGLMDNKGKILVEPRYRTLHLLFGRMAIAASSDGRYGVIDATGETVVPFIYRDAKEFNRTTNFPFSLTGDLGGKLIAVKDDNRKWGFIDRTGETVLPPQYDDVMFWSMDSLVVSAVGKDGKQGLIDMEGKEILPVLYDRVFYTGAGLTWIACDGKCGCIDKTGKLVIPMVYDYIPEKFLFPSRFVWDVARVTKDGKELYIDTQGNEFATEKEAHEFQSRPK
jgi:hypothetical protein